MQTREKHAYVLNVMSHDRPGIVSSVAQAVDERGGNIDACSQTVLEGYFTLIMIVSFPKPLEPKELAENIRTEDDGFQVAVLNYHPPAEPKPGAPERFVVTAFGEDKPGIVLRFSQYLAGKDINIIDLFGDLRGQEFVLLGQVEIPPHLDLAHLQADLEEMGQDEGFAVRLQHENLFVATNQLRMTQP